MSHPKWTYELSLACSSPQAKQRLVACLLNLGETEFVEGVVDDLDIDYAYEDSERDFYSETGGADSPLLLYRYSFEDLCELKDRLSHDFGADLDAKLSRIETQDWMSGWKESFRPVKTARFVVYPPWEPNSERPLGICLDPGMAFGTGQHATTELCLRWLETREPGQNLLDVGTGTGILAIAAKRLGWEEVVATDIEEDARRAALENARVNSVSFSVEKGGVPPQKTFDVVMANILAVVLRKIFSELESALAPDGELVLCGLLAEEADEFSERGLELGLSVSAQHIDSGWCLLALKRSQ